MDNHPQVTIVVQNLIFYNKFLFNFIRKLVSNLLFKKYLKFIEKIILDFKENRSIFISRTKKGKSILFVKKKKQNFNLFKKTQDLVLFKNYLKKVLL